MAHRDLQDTAYASGNPGIYGGFNANTPEETTQATCFDQTPSTPAVAGKCVIRQQVSTNLGGGNYAQGTTANQVAMPGSWGVVVVPAAAVGGKAEIQTKGVIKASVQSTSNANKAIAAGDPLCFDNAGNLTSAPATPAAGTVVATAMAAVAGGTAAAPVLVDLGGAY